MSNPKRNPHHRAPRKWWKSAISIVGTFVLLSAFVVLGTQQSLTSKALAQQDIHANHAPGQTFEPLIDGSVQPEGIPDEVAIRALMQTLRVPPNPDKMALEQLHARVGRVNLNHADMELLVRELGILDTRANEQQARIEAVRPASAEVGTVAIARYVDEQTKLGSIIVDHYEQILASLSPEGAEKLREHLDHVKSRMKIYPSPDMSASAHSSGEHDD